MPTGNEYYSYFEKKNVSYLKRQLKIINTAEKLDKYIQDSFQLNYLPWVKHIIEDVIKRKGGAQ